MSLKPEVICGAKAYACRCGLEVGHAGDVHECADSVCAGQWSGIPDTPSFVGVRMPGELSRVAGVFGDLTAMVRSMAIGGGS